MWLYTTIGFFSVVKKQLSGAQGELQVRARVDGDLEALRERYMPELSPTIVTPRGDYKFRAAISAADFAKGMIKLVQAIDYSNFKSAVFEQQGWERENIYKDVWHASRQLERMQKHG
jgi:hypothetical protein